MSTKFSGHGKLHKPPAVCKAPPAASLLPPKPHDEQIFQGFASWYNEDQTDWIAITASLTMIPVGNGIQWLSPITGEGDELQLLMTWLQPTPEYRFFLRAMRDGVPQDSEMIPGIVPRSMDPFDTGLLLFPPGGPQSKVQARVNY